MKRSPKGIVFLLLALALALAGAMAGIAARPTPALAQNELVVGFVLVGPQNDKGWSQAHFDGSEYLVKNVPGVKKIVVDKVNPGDRPNVTLEQIVENMVQQGAKLIFTTSDDFGADTLKAAEKFTDVTFIHVSGSAVLEGKAPKNLGNVMGKMEYMKMVAGCAAALKTETKSIAYLGPLINDETRRLAVSVYLGARYCYQNYRQADPKELKFEVKWIGFWFNIPGVTLDPTQVANEFFDTGADVVVSGIDTTEALVVAGQRDDRQTISIPK
jgi:simple sugar transport system substrate-binding protein